MAAAKRPHDVISIHSDSSDEDLITLARPPKKARRTQSRLVPDPYYANLLDHERMLESTTTGAYVKAEGEGDGDGSELAELGADAASPQIVSSDHDFGPPDFGPFGFGPPLDFDFPFEGFPLPNAQDDPIVLTDSPPTPERSLLDQVLDVVPDVSHDHVLTLIAEHNGNIEQMMEALLDGEYPKESDKHAAEEAAREAALRQAKAEQEAEQESLHNPKCVWSGKMRDLIIEILKDEFNTVPVKYIREVQKEKKHLYATYLAINQAKHAEPRPYGSTPWRPLRDIDFVNLRQSKSWQANVDIVEQQLLAARKAAADWNAQLRKTLAQKHRDQQEAAAKARDDELNLEHARANGTMAECLVCYDEYPLNRMIQCNAADAHPTCLDCMKTYLSCELGQSSSKLVCPGGCHDTFGESQLRLLPDSDKLVDKLMRLRLEHDMRAAGIDDVEECPFCDYRTVCPPVEVDFEFHCQDQSCNITSCRKCKQKSHIPESCDEYQRKQSKATALDHRHKIEEARSMALIRHCNKCKNPFVKVDGCNKMTCTTCGNRQCYLCHQDVGANYYHFNKPDGCPSFDPTKSLEAQHTEQVNAAAEAAEAQLLRDHPEVDRQYLSINFSEAVITDEERQHAAPDNGPLPVPLYPDLHHLPIHDPLGILLRGQQAQQRRHRLPPLPPQMMLAPPDFYVPLDFDLHVQQPNGYRAHRRQPAQGAVDHAMLPRPYHENDHFRFDDFDFGQEQIGRLNVAQGWAEFGPHNVARPAAGNDP